MPESPKAQDIISDNKVQFVEVKMEAPEETKSENIKLVDCEDNYLQSSKQANIDTLSNADIKLEQSNEHIFVTEDISNDKSDNPEQVTDLAAEVRGSNDIKVNEINENVHNETKRYKCDQCQKSFTTTRNLKQHIDYICITKQGAIRDKDLVTKIQEGTKQTKKTYEKKRHCCVPFCDSYLMKGLFTFPKEDSMKQGP